MDIKKHLTKAAWTEAEVLALTAGMVLSNQLIDDKKIFAAKFASNPSWFMGSREGAPFMIKWSGGIKALSGALAATYIPNPWLKMLLLGVAVQGTLQQVRVLTFNKTTMTDRLNPIGAGREQELDAELKKIAEQSRTNGPEYVGRDLGDRYETSVGAYDEEVDIKGPEYVGRDLGDRYETSVGAFDEMADPFNLTSDDKSWAS